MKGVEEMPEKEVLEQLKTKVNIAANKGQLLELFRSLVILETKCLKNADPEVREIGYQAQTLQGTIEQKI